MPIFDFRCKKCDSAISFLMGLREYEQWESDECEHCGAHVTKDERTYKGITSKVIGVSKGNYNSKGIK